MFIEAIANISFWIQHVNHFIDLVGKSWAEGHNFIVLAHLVKKMLRVGPENIVLGFLCPQTKYLQWVNDQGIFGVTNRWSEVRVGSYC